MPANQVKKQIYYNITYTGYYVTFAIHNGDSAGSHYCTQTNGVSNFYARVSETYSSQRAIMWFSVGY